MQCSFPVWHHASLALCATLAMAAGPAWSQGQIDGIQASATRVLVGELVSFGANWNLAGSFQNGGGSNLVEPAAVEGLQEWVMNWYWTETTTALGIDLQFAGQSHSERFFYGDGAGASGSWGTVMVFDSPGVYDLTLSGSYTLLQTSTYEMEVATRSCFNVGDPEGDVYLDCNGWSYGYPSSFWQSEIGGALSTSSVQVEVVAVPEPGTAALWLAGLAGAAAWRRRRS